MITKALHDQSWNNANVTPKVDVKNEEQVIFSFSVDLKRCVTFKILFIKKGSRFTSTTPKILI